MYWLPLGAPKWPISPQNNHFQAYRKLPKCISGTDFSASVLYKMCQSQKCYLWVYRFKDCFMGSLYHSPWLVEKTNPNSTLRYTHTIHTSQQAIIWISEKKWQRIEGLEL